MHWENKNFKHALPECENGDTFDNCNLSQFQDREIASGKTGLIFINCNLTNCISPPDSIVDPSCNISKINFCYWLHPEWPLPVEVDNCRHVIGTNVIETDDGTITDYVRKDTNGLG